MDLYVSGAIGRDLSSPESESAEVRIPEESLELRYSQNIHRVLFQSAPDAMIATDDDGRILAVNLEAEKNFGYRAEELIGQPVEKLVPGRFRHTHQQSREAYQAAPVVRPMNRGIEMFGMRKDGSEFPLDINLNPVRTENGMVFFSIIRNLSERVASERVRRHLAFEQAFAGLSTKFINLPADQVDQEINSGLQMLCEVLDTDRASLAQFDPDTGDLLTTHHWARPGVPSFRERLPRHVLPWMVERISRGEVLAVESLEDLPPAAVQEREYAERVGIKSTLAVPFRVAGRIVGGISTSAFHKHHRWDEFFVSRVQDIADIFANALSRKWADEELLKALAQIRELKEKIEQENVYLREEIKLEYAHTAVVGRSAGIRAVLKKAEQVAPTNTAVLILGETGTGKELIARTIHELGQRKEHPLVKINCAALPTTLIESELFGREKGAYTGALAREIGRFELAHKSTIFLDEIGELPLELQAKLLRVLQDGEFERLGSSKTISVDVRIVAATNRNLAAMVKEGKFREDLFYRLNVFPIFVPPLRERREDVPAIVWHILKDLGKRMGRNVEGVHATTMRNLQEYSWPGNVRELRNVIERNLIVNSGPIFRADLPELEMTNSQSLRRFDEVEAEYFRNVLQNSHWRVRGRGGAAEILGLKPTTLEARMKKLGIRRPS